MKPVSPSAHDTVTSAPSFSEHLAGPADAVAHERVLALVLALHRLGAGLQDVELAVLAVAAPLDVHGTLVVLLDRHRVGRELVHLGVGEREAVAVLLLD